MLSTAPKRHFLSTGMLKLHTDDPYPTPLFQIEERLNPKRAFLFVSTVLGRYIPVRPKEQDAVCRALARRALGHVSPGPVLVMGYAEAAVGLGAAVARALSRMRPSQSFDYLPTTRHPIVGHAAWLTLTEAHSHAPDHHVCTPPPQPLQGYKTLVLVDDETTTGATFAALAAELQAKGLQFEAVILATLTDWTEGKAVERVARELPEAKIHAVALQTGSWQWFPANDIPPRQLPGPVEASCPVWEPNGREKEGAPRMGIASAELDSSIPLDSIPILPSIEPVHRVLVIGAGENTWRPYLVAEALELAGHDVHLVATTRSPIHPGKTIREKITFPDHFGLGIEMYLHNVNPDEWDWILLFTETTAAGVPAALADALGKGFVIDGDGDWTILTRSKR